MEENQKIPMRSQVKKEDTWAIEDMYATVEDWEKDFATAKKVARKRQNMPDGWVRAHRRCMTGRL